MVKRYKILSIGHSYIVSANRSIMRKLAQNESFDITVAAPRYLHGSLRSMEIEAEHDEKIKLASVDVILSRWIHLMTYRGLDLILQKNSFDLVHIWEEPYVHGGYQIARQCVKTNTPYFFRTAQSLNKCYPPPFSYFEKFVVKNAKAWNAGAGLVFKNLIERGYDQSTGRIISLGTDREKFYPDDEARAEVREELGLKGFIFGFSGRLVESKGLDILMSAFEKLEEKKSPNWSFLALGSGPYKEKLESWAERQGLSDRVKVLLVEHDKMPRYMRAMDCLLAPSQTASNWKEQFGRMLTEAFATKVPVIGSTSGEIPYVIDHAGLVIDEKDSEGWSLGMLKMMEDTAFREWCIEKGFQRFLENYEVEGLAQKYAQLYQDIIREVSDKSL